MADGFIDGGKSRRAMARASGMARSDQLVQLELAKWLMREVGDEKADQVIAFTQVCLVVPLDTEIALAASEACRVHKLAIADAIIFATACSRGATLLTCDKHSATLPGVTLIGKFED